jgi:hypothetical protein
MGLPYIGKKPKPQESDEDVSKTKAVARKEVVETWKFVDDEAILHLGTSEK